MSEHRKPMTVTSLIFGTLAAIGATAVLVVVLNQFGMRPEGWRLVAIGVSVGFTLAAVEAWLKSRAARRRNDYSR